MRYIHEDHEDFQPFPLYPVVLAFKGDASDVVSFPSPAMGEVTVPDLPGMRTLLDAERYIERLAPIPAEGASLTFRQKLVGVDPKPKGALVHFEGELRDEAGERLYRLDSSAFALGAKGVARAGRSLSVAVPLPSRPPDTQHDEVVPDVQARLYRLSGDYNPLHIDPAMAALAGFERPVLHGLCSLGFAVRAVLERCAHGDGSLFRAARARFVGTVAPGDKLRTKMWVKGGRITFTTEVIPPSGTPKLAISNAYVDLTSEASVGPSSRL